MINDLVTQQYRRSDQGFQRGNFRVRGDSLEVWPAHLEDRAWRLSFFGEELESIAEFDPLTGKKGASLTQVRVFANSHYVTPGPTMKQATEAIRFELTERLRRELTREHRQAILEIKRFYHSQDRLRDGLSMQIYLAVLNHGVRSVAAFQKHLEAAAPV